MLEVRILPGEPNPFRSISCGLRFFLFFRTVITPSGFLTKRTISIVQKPNVFDKKIIEKAPTIRLVTECLIIGCQSVNPHRGSSERSAVLTNDVIGTRAPDSRAPRRATFAHGLSSRETTQWIGLSDGRSLVCPLFNFSIFPG